MPGRFGSRWRSEGIAERFGVRRAARVAARAAVALVHAVWDAPGAVSAVQPVGRTLGRPVPVGRPFVVLLWNVQFCAGRSRKFFYDGGDAVHVDPADQERTIARIAQVLAAQDADLVLLQEVDRGSDRTRRVDQHAELLARVPYPCHASTPYHQVRFVPHPPGDPLGRVDTHLSVFSRFTLSAGRRYALAPLAESWLRRQFNLRRAVLELDLPTDDGRTVRVCDAHLSAFSYGDGTLARQVEALAQRIAAADRDGAPYLVGGDFNALPPGDDPRRLGADAHGMYEPDPPLGPLFGRSAIPLEAHQDAPERWRTWMPFGSDTADRAIDHLLVSPEVEVLDSAVLTGVTDASDHLPMRFELQLSGGSDRRRSP